MAAVSTRSIRTRIMEQFVLALQGLDVAGSSLGQRVYRAWRDPSAEGGNFPMAFVFGANETKIAGGSGGARMRFYECHLFVDVWLWVRLPGQDSTTDASEILERALADVENAITNRVQLQGGSGSATGLADWTHLVENQVSPPGLEAESAEYGSLRCGFEVQYRHRDINADGNT